jgi:hypothetical protein
MARGGSPWPSLAGLRDQPEHPLTIVSATFKAATSLTITGMFGVCIRTPALGRVKMAAAGITTE